MALLHLLSIYHSPLCGPGIAGVGWQYCYEKLDQRQFQTDRRLAFVLHLLMNTHSNRKLSRVKTNQKKDHSMTVRDYHEKTISEKGEILKDSENFSLTLNIKPCRSLQF